ncbi:RNA polymerase sigma factor [Chitinophaga pinensis]|uniref:Sigma-70 family RNA polymerase sigma factor n=1 Tax=Chitinophaga pinensis TaxID=79329 RepID=A0A5C6LSI3_9BACT|nr:sigma-70 family RNA polymerase sigma factor [Chitinophaga pinensis]TWW00415.1 sigma-70 family RNA polymerase sigma factor [Chitinophaga pinensis]
MTDTNDEILLSRLRNGDTTAFDEIYLRYKGPAILLARSLLRSSMHQAEDLVHDIFEEWWEKEALKGLKLSNLSLEGYLKKAVRYKCADYFRKRNKDTNRETTYGAQEEIQTEITHEISDMEQRVATFLQKLQPMPKNVITLKYLEEYKIKDIAAQCGVTSQVIRNHLHIGMKKLREKLGVR